jgi:hypothetical protein
MSSVGSKWQPASRKMRRHQYVTKQLDDEAGEERERERERKKERNAICEGVGATIPLWKTGAFIG